MKNNSYICSAKIFRGTIRLSMLVGIFYARTANIRQSTPCVYCNGVHIPSHKEVLATGSGLPLFFQPFNKLIHLIMPKTNEKSLMGKIIPFPNSPDSAKTVSRFLYNFQKYQNEEAHRFISSKGLHDEFMDYCFNHSTPESDREYLNYLLYNVE